MRILNKRVVRVIAEQKLRFAGIVMLVLLGSFYYTVATGVAGGMERAVNGFAEANRQEDLTFTTDKPVPNVPEIAARFHAVVEPKTKHDVGLQGADLRLLADDARVNVPAVLEGRGLRSSGEVLVDPRFLAARGLHLGSRMVLENREFTIVGTTAVPDYVYILKNFYDVLPTTGFGIGVASRTDVAELSSVLDDVTTTYSVRFDDRDGIDVQTGHLRERIREGGASITEWMVRGDNPRIKTPSGNIKSLQSMSVPVSVVFFLLGCVMVSVMTMRHVKSDGVVIGALYALGYRSRELTRHYVAVPVLVAAVGAAVGTASGVLVTGPAIRFMLASYNVPYSGSTHDPSDYAIAVLAPVVLIGSASLFAVRRVLRKPAADLMKGEVQTPKPNFVERAIRLDRFRFATKFQVREQVRSLPRLSFLIFGVAAATMIMLFGLTFKNSMDVVTEQGALARYDYPLEYNFASTQNLGQRSLPPGAEPYNTMRVHPDGKPSLEFYLTGMDPDSVGMKLVDTNGSRLRRDQVNITYPLAERLGLGRGDTVQIVSNLDGAPYTLRIDGIISASSEQFMTMPREALNRMTGQPAGSYRTVLADREMDFDPRRLSGILDTRDPDAFDSANAPTGLIVASVTALAVLIAIVILFLVTSLIIEENRRTIGLLKIMGYRRKEIAKLILNGSTPVVIVGFVLGVPLTILFVDALYTLVADTINMVIPVAMSPVHVATCFAVTMVVYQLTTWSAGRRILKMSMGDALKGTE